MERLTQRLADGTAYTGALINASIKGVTYPTYIGKAADKLAEYEDAEEQGLLLRLPCKIGDTVYETYRDGEYCSSWWDIRQRKFTLAFYEKHLNDFHKTVFLL